MRIIVFVIFSMCVLFSLYFWYLHLCTTINNLCGDEGENAKQICVEECIETESNRFAESN